jgi:hypothetical protein
MERIVFGHGASVADPAVVCCPVTVVVPAVAADLQLGVGDATTDARLEIDGRHTSPGAICRASGVIGTEPCTDRSARSDGDTQP